MSNAIERYRSKVEQRGPDDCWPWTAGRSKKNYGVFSVEGKPVPAHRYGFSVLRRPLRPDETVDHTCHNTDPDCPGGDTCEHRACQNPAHWEAVPDLVNQARGKSFSAVNARKTHCDSGHELTPENSYGYKGRRQCKKCARKAAREQTGTDEYQQQRKRRYQEARAAGFSPEEARRMRYHRSPPS